MTADLRRGRDPLTPCLTPLPDRRSLRAAAGRRRLTAPGHGTAAMTRSTPRVIVFDTGRLGDQHYADRLSRKAFAAPIRGSPAEGEQPMLALADLSRTLSKTHALLEWSGSVLWVTDLHSANGSVLVSPDGESRPLVPGIRGAAAIGWTVECGSRSFKVHAVPQRAAS